MTQAEIAAAIPGLWITLWAILCYLMAAILNAVELSLAATSRAAAQDLVDEGLRGSAQVFAQVHDRKRSERSVRSVRLLLQTLATIFITLVFIQLELRWWWIALLALLANWVLLSVLISMFPRLAARRNPQGVLLAMRQLTSLCVRAVSIFDPLLGVVIPQRVQSVQTEAEARHEMADDLREMVDQVGEADLFENEDRQMLRSVFELGQTLVREVMLPRTEMITIGMDESLSEAMDLFLRSGFSRLPVVGEDTDDIRGIIYFKDCTRRVSYAPETSQSSVTSCMRAAHFVPETLYVDDLLRQMQGESFHLALAIDEWGGVAGLVTLEDILEELVGELTDEHDSKEAEPIEVGPGVWQVPSRFAVDDLGEIFGIELDDEDVDTVGGLVAKELNKVPLPGAKITVKNLEIEALEAIGRRKQVANYRVSEITQNTSEPSLR